MATQIQLRRGTATQWTTANPVLAQGELGLESDTGKFKVGNGVNNWSTLAYSSGPQGPQGAASTVAGPIGPTGPAGPAGTQGVSGSQGPQGAQGVAGANGPQGSSGVAGPQGPQGFQGSNGQLTPSDLPPASPNAGDLWFNSATAVSYIYFDSHWVELGSGSQGPTGPQGTQGAQGVQGAPSTAVGPQGPQGFQGAQGAQGTQGSPSTAVGPQGPQGFQGTQGVAGSNGVQGSQGVQGAQGSVGPQGPQGFQGVTGRYTASDTAPSSPVAGDIWFNSLTAVSYIYFDSFWIELGSGSQGPQGSSGVQGTQGPQGPQGFQGDTGAAGAAGSQGPQGAAGTNGTQGPQGAQGAQGDASTVAGPQGPAGAQGVAGAQGPQGVQGATTVGTTIDVTAATSSTVPVTVRGAASQTANLTEWRNSSGTVVASVDAAGGKRFVPRVTTISSSATPTINTDVCDAVTITAQAAAITSMTTNLSGAPNNFDRLVIRIKDNGTARAITWGSSFVATGVPLPTTTVASKVTTVGFIYDSVKAAWGCVAAVVEA